MVESNAVLAAYRCPRCALFFIDEAELSRETAQDAGDVD
jgi:hypothetical protein